MRHMGAFYQSATITSLVTINAVADQSIFTSGKDLRVPNDLPYLSMAAALHNDAGFTQAQVQSPTLRDLAPFDVSPNKAALVFPSPHTGAYLYDNPLQLTGNEALNFAFAGADAGNIVSYGLVELTDGPVKPVTGEIFTVRATGTAALSAGVWVNTPLTLGTTLPAGKYNLVGLRAEGANLVAARTVLIGQAYRPGVLACTAISDVPYSRYRYGGVGSFGMFDINQPPTIDCLGVTDTTQRFYLDLIAVK